MSMSLNGSGTAPSLTERLSMLLGSASRYWKTIIATVGLAATVLTSLQPLWGANTPSWVPVIIAALTAVGVYAKTNTPPTGQLADPNVSEADAK